MSTTLTRILTSPIAITFDLSSLGTSATFVAGRECTQIDNSSNNYIDAIVNVKGILSHASTAPTIGQLISLTVWGADTSLGTTAIDTLVGTDAARTLSNVAVYNSLIPAGRPPVVTVATANLKNWIMPFSVAALLNGVMPNFWGMFVSHNQNGALAAGNSGLLTYQGVTYLNT